MNNEKAKRYYYIIFDEVRGTVYEEGDWETTRTDAFERIQDLHYSYLKALKKNKTKSEQLRSIIKDNQEAAIRELRRMTGKEY